MRAVRFRTCRIPRPAIFTRSALFQMFGDHADQVVQHLLASASGLSIGGMLQRVRNSAAKYGRRSLAAFELSAWAVPAVGHQLLLPP
jgi:hypothetical protein